jgi:hypothetical protein
MSQAKKNQWRSNVINAAHTISVAPNNDDLVFDVTRNSGHSIPDGYYSVINCGLRLSQAREKDKTAEACRD